MNKRNWDLMKLLAVDGNSLMYRAFYGIKSNLTSRDGIPTGAVTGFFNILLGVMDKNGFDHIAVAFDRKEPTFRKEKFAEYKAGRKPMPDELVTQMGYIKDIIKAMGITLIECAGYEADDIIGTLASETSRNGGSCYILTGDRDALQLINENTIVLLQTMKGIVTYTEAVFEEEYHFPAINLIDLKALMGDTSDNYLGVKGIGEKTAKSLIENYKTIDNLYAELEDGNLSETKSVLSKLEAGKEDAYTCRWLATIDADAPIGINASDCEKRGVAKLPPDTDKLAEILSELNMNKLLERLSIKPVIVSKMPEIEIKADLKTYDSVFMFKDGEFITEPPVADINAYFQSDMSKACYNAKPAYKYALQNGIAIKNIADDGYILASNLNMTTEMPEIKDLSDMNARLRHESDSQGMGELIDTIEYPLIEVIAAMEEYGIAVDTDGIKKFGELLKTDMAKLEEEIYSMAGESFNILSPKQLGTVLFEKLALPHGKKLKSGGYSTGADVLENLADHSPVVKAVLEYRGLSKLNSTYVEGLLSAVRDDGRVHSTFNQTETRTGRLSSENPNLQNIPVRTERGREMRKFFIAKKGCVLLDADYSQIELRILASMADDKNMQENFRSGIDFHTATAAKVFDVPPEMVTPGMRRAAKAVNFGIVYGIGAFSLSKDIGSTVKQAEKYIENYFAAYTAVKKFLDETEKNASENGYVTTLFGRKRIIAELSSSNKNLRGFGLRAARNAPIQGTAADIMKIAMINVYNRLRAEKLETKLILQVHDELILEAPLSEKDIAAKILSEEMIGAAKLSVPLEADVHIGENWFTAKG
ncbi:MAG: DNA polymerase I [Ruminococcus sp.]|jgi:DNA polymerase-1|nr:DNA polymerase I [Ruminococcus sp.]